MNPVEEFLAFDSGLEKTAQAPASWAARHPMAATAAIGVATPLAVMAAQEGYGEIKSMVSRARGFKRMMGYNPGLKKLPADKAKAMFNTLHNAAPDLAKDPVVASSFVNRMALQDDYVDPRTLADLGAAQKNIGRGGLEFPVAALTTGMMGTVNDPMTKQLDRAVSVRKNELEQAKNVAAEARTGQLHAGKLRQQEERHQQALGHNEGNYQAGVQRLDAAARSDRARARFYNKQSAK